MPCFPAVLVLAPEAGCQSSRGHTKNPSKMNSRRPMESAPSLGTAPGDAPHLERRAIAISASRQGESSVTAGGAQPKAHGTRRVA